MKFRLARYRCRSDFALPRRELRRVAPAPCRPAPAPRLPVVDVGFLPKTPPPLGQVKDVSHAREWAMPGWARKTSGRPSLLPAPARRRYNLFDHPRPSRPMRTIPSQDEQRRCLEHEFCLYVPVVGRSQIPPPWHPVEIRAPHHMDISYLEKHVGDETPTKAQFHRLPQVRPGTPR